MASSSCALLGLACFVLLAAAAGATQYKVGGDNGWAVPDATAESFNTWAEKTSFQIGDSLLFVYPKDKDSVLLVEPADYNACNTSSYDKQFDDGSTSVALDRAGAFFFISGVEANCRANEKLIVMVAGAGAPAPAPDRQGSGSSSSPSTSAPVPSKGGGAPVPPSSPKAPAAKNSTAKGAPPAAGTDRNGAGAGLAVAGLVASVAGCVAHAMLAL
ncbi:early nodulin-like protein 1 [Zea mays]|uniref:Early nodulin-like protein 9 n=1 Tax=Zea mays TaxID=4577 RepID=K7V6Z4_MAIZE|nr:early nodulin-like protein 1 [Zea mays]AQK60480.1 early nodulin-like protein 9 [Zea mays]|eukprot:XP_008679934.1 early nodulin-like protein 1 [Zea mays]